MTTTKITEVVYYTDPLCCWSWAMDKAVGQLAAQLGTGVDWRYCMCGLIPDWDHFTDPVNSVTRPIQMGPVWMHAQAVSGALLNSSIWHKDPPASSYPACIAVKCVGLQDQSLVPVFLNNLRKECMADAVNIASDLHLVRIAGALAKSHPHFDMELFRHDLVNGRGREAFRLDLDEIRAKGIDRFPAMLVRKSDGTRFLASGYRSYEQLAALCGLTSGLNQPSEV